MNLKIDECMINGFRIQKRFEIRPSLTIAHSGTNVLVAWPLSADPGYVLQSTTSLASPATWTTVTNVVTVSINQNVVSLPRPAAAKFFRLQK